MALARVRRHALYEHADPRRGAHPDWGTLVFNLGRNEVRNFLIANALYWVREYHADGLRVDAVASMLYLDYSRKAGRVGAERVRRPRGSRRGRLPPALNECSTRATRRRSRSPRSRPPGRACPADLPRRAWLRLQVEHGLDARHAQVLRKDPIHRRFHHHELTFSLIYAFSENFVLPLSHDEVVHGKGSLLARCPATAGSSSRTCAPLRVHVGASRQEAALHGRRARRVASEWNHERHAGLGAARYAEHEGVRALVRDLNLLYRAGRRSRPSTSTPPASAGSTRRRRQHPRLRAALARRRGTCLRVQPDACPRTAYQVGVPGAPQREVLNTDSAPTAGAAPATSDASSPRPLAVAGPAPLRGADHPPRRSAPSGSHPNSPPVLPGRGAAAR